MLEKVLANQDKADRILNGLIVGSHSASIQKLESQIRDISREQHPPQKGGLLSDTILNPKSGRVTEEEEAQSDVPTIIDEVQTEVPITKKVTDIPKNSKKHECSSDTSKATVKKALRPLIELFKSKPPFPQRLVKKTKDAKCQRFYDQLKQLSMNISFLDAFHEMPGFVKYLKELLTKKRTIKHDTVSLTHHFSSINTITSVQKKEDPEAFTILCSVGHLDFARALCDNEASINLMPLTVYKQSGFGMPRPTTMRLHMANRSIKRPVGVVDDVLSWVGEFLLQADFVIFDCAVDQDIPIILGRPFLSTGRALMDSETNKIKFRVND
ncbi:uncharacterized protein LOC132044239 [Lycium ferocissimum]|uniref:uncharacterized protein LOC132044239 n=1 Tax=Lycium ferocissimum TaxID=112874 RepID=UPI00281642F8|nr:uncharacterized protein LOC132044239 [Lycium ferocissimum]